MSLFSLETNSLALWDTFSLISGHDDEGYASVVSSGEKLHANAASRHQSRNTKHTLASVRTGYILVSLHVILYQFCLSHNTKPRAHNGATA